MGGGSQTVTQKNDPPKWLQPHLEEYVARGKEVADQPYQAYTGQRVADINPVTAQAYGSIYDRAMQGSPEVGAARADATKSLTGGYLGENNPYLSQVIDSASSDVTRNFQNAVTPQTEAAFARKGAFGGSTWGQTMADNSRNLAGQLGNIATDIRYKNYGDERNRMMQYAGLAPTLAATDYQDAAQMLNVGEQLGKRDQSILDTNYQNFLEARNYPKEQLGTLSGVLTGANYGNTSSGTQPGVSPIASTLGGALVGSQIASLLPSSLGITSGMGAAGGALLGLLSDRRAKKDIKKVGKTDDGLNIYTYKYKGGEDTHMGVMAQEAEKKHPEAVKTGPDGYKRVNYGLLG